MALVHRLGGSVDGNDVLGWRGAGLARLAALELPIAPGFVVSTAAWHLARLPGSSEAKSALGRQIDLELAELERRTGRRLDDRDDPLLLTVMTSSAAPESGPATVIADLGLSTATVSGLCTRTSPRFAWWAYRDLVRAFCADVHDLDARVIQDALAHAGRDPGAQIGALKSLLYATGHPWPDRARDQVDALVHAVLSGAPEPSALVVQARACGAGPPPSGSGIVFTRDPASGAPRAFGQYWPGTDWSSGGGVGSHPLTLERLIQDAPVAARALQRELASIEVIHRDMCEVQFTLEAGQIFLRDAHPGSRSSAASVQIAVDLVDVGLIDVEAAIRRIPLSAFADLALGPGEVAPPGVALSRALGWVADGSALPTRDAPPRGAAVIDLSPDLGVARAALVAAWQAQPHLALWVALPDGIDGDLQPPPGRWAGVVAPAQLRGAADVLAWRLSRANRLAEHSRHLVAAERWAAFPEA